MIVTFDLPTNYIHIIRWKIHFFSYNKVEKCLTTKQAWVRKPNGHYLIYKIQAWSMHVATEMCTVNCGLGNFILILFFKRLNISYVMVC